MRAGDPAGGQVERRAGEGDVDSSFCCRNDEDLAEGKNGMEYKRKALHVARGQPRESPRSIQKRILDLQFVLIFTRSGSSNITSKRCVEEQTRSLLDDFPAQSLLQYQISCPRSQRIDFMSHHMRATRSVPLFHRRGFNWRRGRYPSCEIKLKCTFTLVLVVANMFENLRRNR